jgi:adenylate kinase
MPGISLIVGPPGSGKSTISNPIALNIKATHFSTGDLFRAEKKKWTSLGITFAKFQDNGILIPDNIADPFIFENLSIIANNNILLDGYPRTIAQANYLHNWISKKEITARAIFELDVNLETIVDRISKRVVCVNAACMKVASLNNNPNKICKHCGSELIRRKDDSEEIIIKRYNEYFKLTKPAIDYLVKNKVFELIKI